MYAINDLLVLTHSPASSDRYSYFKYFYLRDFEKWTLKYTHQVRK